MNEHIEERKSRTQIKKEMIALQKLGERLVDLSASQINEINMDEELKEAILFAKTLTKHGARKRQMQYIGALMRETDVTPIQKSIELIELGQKIDAHEFLKIEKWRNELIQGNKDTLSEIIDLFPELDRQHLNQLVRNAKKEEIAEKPPKSSRTLFRYLKKLSKGE